MTKEQFARERDYGAAVSIAKALLRAGLITEWEYRKIDTNFSRKYRPVIGGLRLENP
jgi:hypothetical protein